METPFLVIVSVLALISLIFHASYVFGSLGIKDIPNERSLHTEITKKSGGMIFIPLFLISVLIWIYLYPGVFSASSHIKLLLLGTLFFCLLGFVDDLYHLSPNLRLLLEFTFAFVLVYQLKPTISLFGHAISNPMTAILVLGFLIVFIVNLVNFMDGLDWYLIGTFLLSAIFWIPIFSNGFLPSRESFLLLVFLFSALFGFSFFNFPKAKLFMGDSGSLALGFLIVFIPCMTMEQTKEQMDLLSLFFLFPIFWIDGTITIIIRLFQKKHIFSAHREHLFQLLTETRFGKPATCFLMIFSNLPAYLLYSLYQLKWIPIGFSRDLFVLYIIAFYILVYGFVRIVFFGTRKNLA